MSADGNCRCLTSAARLGHVEETSQSARRSTTRANDMRVIKSNRRLSQAKTRQNAYEIPTWAIADAIRRRTTRVNAGVPDEPEPPLPQTPDDASEVAVPEAIAVSARGGRP